jgi:hypothetical protein
MIDVRVVSTLGKGSNDSGFFDGHCLIQTSLPGPIRDPEGHQDQFNPLVGESSRMPKAYLPALAILLGDACRVSSPAWFEEA